MSVYKKLFEIQTMNLVMTADAENPYYKSKYVSIENIMSTLKPILAEKQLLLYHIVNGGSVATFLIDMETDYGKPEGQIVSQFPLDPELNAQQRGAEITYGKRYNIVAMFCLTEEDDDGNAAVTPPANYKSNSEAPKKQYAAPTKTTGFGGKSFEKADRWITEWEVNKMLTDIASGEQEMPMDGDALVRELRTQKIGVKKEFAELIKVRVAQLQKSEKWPFRSDSGIGIEDVPF